MLCNTHPDQEVSVIYLQVADRIKSRKKTHEGKADDGDIFPDSHLFLFYFSLCHRSHRRHSVILILKVGILILDFSLLPYGRLISIRIYSHWTKRYWGQSIFKEQLCGETPNAFEKALGGTSFRFLPFQTEFTWWIRRGVFQGFSYDVSCILFSVFDLTWVSHFR